MKAPRAWHKTEKRMLGVFQIAFHVDGSVDHIVDNELQLHLPDEVEFLWPTGWTVTDGEVYQGDVLQCTNRLDPNYQPRFEVTYRLGCFIVGTCTVHEFLRIFESNPRILGSALSNPELLEVKE